MGRGKLQKIPQGLPFGYKNRRTGPFFIQKVGKSWKPNRQITLNAGHDGDSGTLEARATLGSEFLPVSY
jgi:hypothetical protein